VLPGRDPALLLKQEGAVVFSVDLATSQCDGTVVVALHGELDLVDAAEVAAALVIAGLREPRIIVDLAALDFIDSSGIAALAYARKHYRQAGGDLVLAAPRQQVLRVLAATRLIDDFCVHASVAAAAGREGGSERVVVPMQPTRRMRWPGAVVRSSRRAARVSA
jgi:anti-sigma B factor antagonist